MGQSRFFEDYHYNPYALPSAQVQVPERFMSPILHRMAREPASSSFFCSAHVEASTSVDWKETSTEHVFTADLPGMKKEEVQVQLEDDRTLSFSGLRKEEVQKTDFWHLEERSRDQFMGKITLPMNAKLDHITAKVENGLLTVVVPKKETKRVTINAQH